MFDKIFGNEAIAIIYLNLFHYGEVCSALIEKNSKIGSRAVLNQVNKMEEGGILVSRYTFAVLNNLFISFSLRFIIVLINQKQVCL